MRARGLLLVLVFAAGLAVPMVAFSRPAAREAQSTTTTTSSTTTTNDLQASQRFFKRALMDDDRTVASIRDGLDSGALFVDPATQFGDLTGDGKADAVVRVDTGGAAGSVAVYVFSTDGQTAKNAKLRVVYRNQQLRRVLTRLEGGGVVISVPKYARGDEPCCASARIERTYTWQPKSKTFARTATRTISLLAPPTTTTGR